MMGSRGPADGRIMVSNLLWDLLVPVVPVLKWRDDSWSFG